MHWWNLCQPAAWACIKVLIKHSHMDKAPLFESKLFLLSALSLSLIVYLHFLYVFFTELLLLSDWAGYVMLLASTRNLLHILYLILSMLF